MEQKITFLENEEKQPTKSSTEKSEEKIPEKSEEIEEKEKELKEIQAERQNFLNPYRTQERYLQDEISRLKYQLQEDTLSAQKDW